MKKVLCSIAMISLIIFSVAGCKRKVDLVSNQNLPSAVQVQPGVNGQPKVILSVVNTFNNNSYIPLNIEGAVEDNVQIILAVENEFEEKNRNIFTVISYDIVASTDYSGRVAVSRIHGIWSHHQPK